MTNGIGRKEHKPRATAKDQRPVEKAPTTKKPAENPQR